MSCESVRELMSAYHDRELTPDLMADVRKHLDTCPDCAQQLARFAELSKLAADMRQPQLPAGMWSSINSSLEEQRQGRTTTNAPRRRLSQVAIAATLLVVATAAVLAYRNRPATHDHREMTETFGRYLDRFEQQPDRAQELLLARYQGRLVEPRLAAEEAEFQPNAPDTLPQGFSRAAIYVLKMPCCICTQTIYKDGHGNVLALFEHTDEQRGWFGERPMITTHCGSKSMYLVETGDRLAGCWKSGARFLTIVGVRDLEQITHLVSYLDERARSREATPKPT